MSPDHRAHRGAHPEDAELFAPAQWPCLQAATADLSWLLERQYASVSALKLAGDRYSLHERQRMGVGRAACGATNRERRLQTRVPTGDLAGQDIAVDGFNLLITVEAALSGGLILRGVDGCARDLASVHSTYRAVEETVPALTLIGKFLHACAPHSTMWLLDSPVSNSGRLAATMRELAGERGWNWQVETVLNPDAVLKTSPQVVVSSDRVILDRAARWTDIASAVLAQHIPNAWIVDMSAARDVLL